MNWQHLALLTAWIVGWLVLHHFFGRWIGAQVNRLWRRVDADLTWPEFGSALTTVALVLAIQYRYLRVTYIHELDWDLYEQFQPLFRSHRHHLALMLLPTALGAGWLCLLRCRTLLFGGLALLFAAVAIGYAMPSELSQASIASKVGFFGIPFHGFVVSGKFVVVQSMLVLALCLYSGLLSLRWSGWWLVPVAVGATAAGTLAAITPVVASAAGYYPSLAALCVLPLAIVAMPPMRRQLVGLMGLDERFPWRKRHEVSFFAFGMVLLLCAGFSAVHDRGLPQIGAAYPPHRPSRLGNPQLNAFLDLRPLVDSRDDRNVALVAESYRSNWPNIMQMRFDDWSEVVSLLEQIDRSALAADFEEYGWVREALEAARTAAYYRMESDDFAWKNHSSAGPRWGFRLQMMRIIVAIQDGDTNGALHDIETLLIVGDLMNQGAILEVFAGVSARSYAANGASLFLQRFRHDPEAVRRCLDLLLRHRRITMRRLVTTLTDPVPGPYPLVVPYGEYTMEGGFWRAFTIYQRGVNHFVELEIGCALELYRHQYGSYPESLQQLVPEFLPHEPRDQYRGSPFVYTATGDRYALDVHLEMEEHNDLVRQIVRTIRLVPSDQTGAQ